MSISAESARRRVIFVSRAPTGEDLRSAEAIGRLGGVKVLGIAEPWAGERNDRIFADLLCVTNAHDEEQLIAAAQALASKHGPLARIVTTTETLLEPVARANEQLGLEGMTAAAVRRALNKSRLKATLELAGIGMPASQVLNSIEDARLFANSVGFPIVLKPLGGSGGLATWRIRHPEQLELALDLIAPSIESPVMGQASLNGNEVCLDTITVDGMPLFHSICCYRPSILDALEDPSVQWCCVMPRDISILEYRSFIEQGLAAVQALSIGNAITHMEGFLLEAGGVSFTDATLRPAGARIAPMLGFAYDMDPYLAWARVAVDGCFDGPWERKYAVGTIFVRGRGDGFVEQVKGIESVRERLGELLVDARRPKVGAAKSVSYTGDGYFTVRHPETSRVEEALDFVSRTYLITYSHPEPPLPAAYRWKERLGYFDKQLYRPAWEADSLTGGTEQ